MRARGLIGLGLAIVAWAAGGSVAVAKNRPIYRDPPSYVGVKKPPKTKAVSIPAPPPVALSSAGSFPDVLVDEAGTAHIVWNEDRGDAADVVVYCRLKRGASACDTRSELVWDKSYNDGDGPQFSVGSDPLIVRVGDQLVVLEHRYPTGADRPDGSAGSENDLEWTSSDGGTTWAGPAIVGTRDLASVVVFGPPDDPTILNFGIDPYCGPSGGPAAACAEAFKSGQFRIGEAQLGTVHDANYYPSAALDGGLPIVAFADLSDNTYVRRWTGTGGDPDDASTWAAPTTITPSEEPFLAGGVKGTFLLDRPGYGKPYEVRPLASNADGSVTPGKGVRVGDPDGGGQFGVLFEDPAGGLFAGWESHGSEKPKRSAGMLLRASTNGGASFAPAQQLVRGNDIGQIQLGAAADGGGFAVLNRTGFVNSEGEIDAAGFGNQAATGKPGIADLPGGGGIVPSGSSCGELKFGSFAVDSPQGCFLKGTGASSGVFVTTNEVDIWGLRIVPDPGCRVVIDPKLLRIDTPVGCSASVLVSAPDPVGDIMLFHGEIHRDLSAVTPGTDLFEFPAGAFKANILGFDVGADINVRLERDGVHIPVDLELPPAFGGFSGHAELVADRDTGLHLNSLHLHIGPVPLGVLVINSLDLDYSPDQDTWTGAGSISVPAGGTLDGTATFKDGAFNGAQFGYTPTTPIAIGPFVYLLSIGGGFFTDPTHIIATASFGAGVAAAGESPIQIDGRFDMTFPADGPGIFKLSGSVSLFFIHVGDAFLRFETDGYADFGGKVGFDLGPLSMDASTDGFVDATTGAFGADVKGDVKLCVNIKLTDVCAGASGDTAVSNKGFAACASFSVLGDDISGGIEYPWSDFDPVAFVDPFVAVESIISHLSFPCSTGDYHVPPPRAQRRQAGGGTTVDVAGGLPSETILVKGDGAAPKVAVSGPGGSFTSEQPGAAGLVVVPRGVDAAYVVLKKPKAGAWTVTPEPGSAAITQVMTSDGYVAATVRAKLGGQGRRRSIAYRVAHGGHGQAVQFLERGAFGTHVLGTVARARGVLRFAPADAKGGRRTVFALVQHEGIVLSRTKVGSYVAPGPLRSAAVRGLRARRHGTAVTVSWRGAARAARYAVRLRGTHMRLGQLVGAKVHHVRFAAVRRGEKVTVTVVPLSAKLRSGPARRVTAR